MAVSAEKQAGLEKEDLELIIGSLRDYAREHLPDSVLLDLDHRDEFPESIVRGMCGEELGIQLLFIPEAFNGMGGGAFDVYRVCEMLARIDLGVATGVFATFLGSDPIFYGGTPEQQKHWLTRLADEGLLMAYAATEPEAGSDLGALKTTATPVVEDGATVGYRIRGNKQWISNGGYADLYSVLASTPGGPSWFIVERDVEGLSHGRPEDKHGIRISNTSTVTFDDVYVDADRLLGLKEGQGLLQAQMVFGYTRLMVAAFGLGAGWAALDRAIPYAAGRIQGGTPLSEKQGYTHKLIVPHVVALEAARAFIEETADRIDAGEQDLQTEGAIAKYLATEAGNRAADAAIQALGGYGYTREYMVEKIKRDVRITTIYEGTSEIMEMTISRDRWQLHLKTRGQHYHDVARNLESLQARYPDAGLMEAALAHHALAEILEKARVARLTRNQHILLRLGELIAYVEGAGCFARHAVSEVEKKANPKRETRFSPETTALLSRVFAREAALKVATEGLKWIAAAGGLADGEMERFSASVGLPAILQAQGGQLADMDAIVERLYVS